MAQRRMTSAEFRALLNKKQGNAVVAFKPAFEVDAFWHHQTFYLQLPIRTCSEINKPANNRAARIAKVQRGRSQKEEVRMEWQRAFGGLKRKPTLPCRVTLTRVASRLLDDDNLRSAFKKIRDEMAAIIGVDDGSSEIRFKYEQEKIERRAYGIRIKVESVV